MPTPCAAAISCSLRGRRRWGRTASCLRAGSAALDLVAVMRAELGSLDRVARVVEVQGFLNATPEFEDHAKVLDGCSDLLVAVSYTHLRAHETPEHLVCRLLLEKK